MYFSKALIALVIASTSAVAIPYPVQHGDLSEIQETERNALSTGERPDQNVNSEGLKTTSSLASRAELETEDEAKSVEQEIAARGNYGYNYNHNYYKNKGYNYKNKGYDYKHHGAGYYKKHGYDYNKNKGYGYKYKGYNHGKHYRDLSETELPTTPVGISTRGIDELNVVTPEPSTGQELTARHYGWKYGYAYHPKVKGVLAAAALAKANKLKHVLHWRDLSDDEVLAIDSLANRAVETGEEDLTAEQDIAARADDQTDGEAVTEAGELTARAEVEQTDTIDESIATQLEAPVHTDGAVSKDLTNTPDTNAAALSTAALNPRGEYNDKNYKDHDKDKSCHNKALNKYKSCVADCDKYHGDDYDKHKKDCYSAYKKADGKCY